MWQKCPLCSGLGYLYPTGISNVTTNVCTVCNGTKIISELTGLPPKPKEMVIKSGNAAVDWKWIDPFEAIRPIYHANLRPLTPDYVPLVEKEETMEITRFTDV